jgi:hypothetical protein
MTNHHTGWAPDRERSSASLHEVPPPSSARIPGLPHNTFGLPGRLGALVGGMLTGAVLGIWAGPAAAPIAAGVGGCVGLLAQVAVSRRRRTPSIRDAEDAETDIGHVDFEPPMPQRSHSWSRLFAPLAGPLLLLLGFALAVLTAILMVDDRSADRTVLATFILTAAFLGGGATLCCETPRGTA